MLFLPTNCTKFCEKKTSEINEIMGFHPIPKDKRTGP